MANGLPARSLLLHFNEGIQRLAILAVHQESMVVEE